MKIASIPHSHEKIIAQALAPIAKELRLIDIADLIALLRFEAHASLADLVTSSAELYFLPGVVRLGSGGDYVVNWDNDPVIHLDLEINLEHIKIYVRLSLEKHHCATHIDHIDFIHTPSSTEDGARRLEDALSQAAFNAHYKIEMPELRQKA